MNRRRSGERGLSLIEALIMVAATALVATLVLPMLARSVRTNFGLAERSLDNAVLTTGEAEFRALIAGARQPDTPPPTRGATLAGNTAGLTLITEATRETGCADAGVAASATLQVAPRGRGGELLCQASGHRRTLLAWTDGRAALAYSADGRTWSAGWPAARGFALRPLMRENAATEVVMVDAPLVRFTLERPGAAPLVWIERAGGSAPFNTEMIATGADIPEVAP